MTQAAHARDSWADPPLRRSRREPDSWASAEDLEVLGGLGEERVADWTVLTLERDAAPGAGEQAADNLVELEPRRRPRFPARDVAGSRAGALAERVTTARRNDRAPMLTGDEPTDPVMAAPAAASRTAERRPRRDAANVTPLRDADEHQLTLDSSVRVAPEQGDHDRAADGRGSARAANGRRTVVIRGQVTSPRPAFSAERRRPAPRARDRVGHRPDRVAMWAVMLGLLLIVVATMTAG